MKKLTSINPANNSIVGEVIITSGEEIATRVQEAHEVKKYWKMLGARKRADMLKPLLPLFKQRAQEIARLSSQEMGKPISQSLSDLESDSTYFQHFIEEGPKYIENEITFKAVSADNLALHQIVFEPTGVAACIVPWNYPFSNFLWGVIPNLIAGNPVVFKHSEECPLIGKMADELMQPLNLPTGVFSQVYGGGEVGQALAEQNIDLIWFTGSSKTGKALYEIAGKKQIKAILEMGGSDPGVLFADVSTFGIDNVVSQIYSRRFDNCGQICCAVKRLIVHESIFHEVIDKLAKHLESIKVGDPLDPKTQMGPLAAKRQLDLLEAQLDDSIALGAKVVCGGKRPEGFTGTYYLPTLLTNVNREMRVWKEEIFGPVLPVVPFSTEEEAIELANDTIYGLTSVVYSADRERARRVAGQINAGCVDINFASHWRPCNPFGGYKASGMGREHGHHGFQELCQIKVIAE